MKIRMLWAGKTREPFLAQGIGLFVRRIRRYVGLDIVTVRGERIPHRAASEPILLKEGNRLLTALKPQEKVVVLDSSGVSMSSEAFSRFLYDHQTRSTPSLAFVVGSSLGVHKSVADRADLLLSLSAMTLTHEMARLVLLEQIYRACTILAGEKYHK